MTSFVQTWQEDATDHATEDLALCCGSCLETLTPRGSCLNVGRCFAADSRASIGASRTTLKAPRAWTISGNID